MSLEEKIKQTKPLQPELKLALQIWYLQSRLQKIQQNHLDKFGLTPQQYNVLRILKGQGKPCSIKTIKERMLDVNSDVSRMIDRMVKAGLIHRNTSEKDRRASLITLTQQGNKVLNALKEMDNVFVDIFEATDAKRMKEAISFLDEVIKILEK
jgi:DNA-binding MarR family transcriptional regulator